MTIHVYLDKAKKYLLHSKLMAVARVLTIKISSFQMEASTLVHKKSQRVWYYLSKIRNFRILISKIYQNQLRLSQITPSDKYSTF